MSIGGKRISTTTQIFAAMILGSIAGIIFGEQMGAFKFIGDLWVSCIKMIIVPLIMCIMVLAIGSQSNMKSLGHVAFRIVVYYLCVTSAAAVVGITVSSIIKPGVGLDLGTLEKVDAVGQGFSLAGFLSGMISDNIFATFTKGNLMQAMVIAIFFGIAIVNIKNEKSRETVLSWFQSFQDMITTYIGRVIKLAPVGIFFLMADCLGKYGVVILGSLGKFLGAFYISVLVQALVVYCGTVFIFARISPLRFLKDTSEIWLFAGSTGSSAATLPISLRVAKEKFGIPDRISNFCLTLGSNVNQDGTTLVLTAVIMLVAQVNGIVYDIPTLVQLVAVSVLVSCSGAGIPGNIIVKMMIVAETIGLPLDIIAVVAGIYKLIEMGSTACNCLSDFAGTVCIGSLEMRKEAKAGAKG